MVVRLVKYLFGKWNGLRLRVVLAWLRMQGIEIGRGVYIGRNVLVSVERGGTLSLGDRVCIQDYSRIFVAGGGSLRIGDSTFIGRNCEISAAREFLIGDRCAIAAYCTLIDTDKDLNEPWTPWDSARPVREPIRVEDDVWLGYKVTVLKGVRLGRRCVVAASGVVTRDVPAFALVAGVPARVIRRLPAAAASARAAGSSDLR